MGAPILWTPGEKRVLSAGKTMSVKFPFLGFFFLGGGGADFIFMGARIFLINGKPKECTCFFCFCWDGVVF